MGAEGGAGQEGGTAQRQAGGTSTRNEVWERRTGIKGSEADTEEEGGEEVREAGEVRGWMEGVRAGGVGVGEGEEGASR